MFDKLMGHGALDVYWKRKHLEKVMQQIRQMKPEAFDEWMNVQLTKSYQLAEQHWQEAIMIEPKKPASDYAKRLKERVKKIRSEWDGIREIERG